MIIKNSCIALALTFSFHSFSNASIDKEETLHGVHLVSKKMDSVRTYEGSINKTFNKPITFILNSITNFTEKCNNDYKEKREFTDKNTDCKFHNEHLVESILEKNIIKNTPMEENEVDRFVIGRKIYNRGSFGHYELVRIFESKNEQNQKTIEIVQTMLNDTDAEKMISPKFKKDSPFNDTVSVLTLTEVNSNETRLSYKYHAKTDHWLLNKQVTVPQVFASISKSVNEFMDTVNPDQPSQIREVASKH